jgi:hypothetical protein
MSTWLRDRQHSPNPRPSTADRPSFPPFSPPEQLPRQLPQLRSRPALQPRPQSRAARLAIPACITAVHHHHRRTPSSPPYTVTPTTTRPPHHEPPLAPLTIIIISSSTFFNAFQEGLNLTEEGSGENSPHPSFPLKGKRREFQCLLHLQLPLPIIKSTQEFCSHKFVNHHIKTQNVKQRSITRDTALSFICEGVLVNKIECASCVW